MLCVLCYVCVSVALRCVLFCVCVLCWVSVVSVLCVVCRVVCCVVYCVVLLCVVCVLPVWRPSPAAPLHDTSKLAG